MKVGLFAKCDWANLGYTLSECLSLNGFQSKMHALYKHAYNYEKYGEIHTLKSMVEQMEKYDIIQFMHSGEGVLFNAKFTFNGKFKCFPIVHDFIINHPNKTYVIFHGGTVYRGNHDKINNIKIIKDRIHKTIIQTADLLGLSDKKEEWILANVDTSSISPSKTNNAKKIFAHYPSNPRKKNSDFIEKHMNEMLINPIFTSRFDFICSRNNISHNDHLKRIAKSDIYIEHQCYRLNGGRYGEFGVTALEAAAMGKIVITCSSAMEKYNRDYGECPLFISNCQKEFIDTINHIMQMTDEEISENQKLTRAWVCQHHSYNSIANRLINFYSSV